MLDFYSCELTSSSSLAILQSACLDQNTKNIIEAPEFNGTPYPAIATVKVKIITVSSNCQLLL